MYLDWDVYFISKTLSSLRRHEKQAQRGFQVQDTNLMSEHFGMQLEKNFWRILGNFCSWGGLLLGEVPYLMQSAQNHQQE